MSSPLIEIEVTWPMLYAIMAAPAIFMMANFVFGSCTVSEYVDTISGKDGNGQPADGAVEGEDAAATARRAERRRRQRRNGKLTVAALFAVTLAQPFVYLRLANEGRCNIAGALFFGKDLSFAPMPLGTFAPDALTSSISRALGWSGRSGAPPQQHFSQQFLSPQQRQEQQRFQLYRYGSVYGRAAPRQQGLCHAEDVGYLAMWLCSIALYISCILSNPSRGAGKKGALAAAASKSAGTDPLQPHNADSSDVTDRLSGAAAAADADQTLPQEQQKDTEAEGEGAEKRPEGDEACADAIDEDAVGATSSEDADCSAKLSSAQQPAAIATTATAPATARWGVSHSAASRAAAPFCCGTCNTTVPGHDHHCFFINNCVGDANYGRFLLFLLCIAVNAVHVLNGAWTVAWRKGSSVDAALAVFTGALLVAVSGLLAFHLLLVRKGVTTRYLLKHKKGAWERLAFLLSFG